MEYKKDNYLCRRCGMYKTSKSVHVIGTGSLTAKVLVLGEFLGIREDESGLPFDGPAGQLLQYQLNAIGVNYFLSTAIKCRPSDSKGGNRLPTPTEIDCCKAFTFEIIQQIKPRVILAVGKTSLQQLIKLGLNSESIRGQQIYFPDFNLYIVPTYHPSHLIKTNDKLHLNQFIEDLTLAKKLSELPPPRRLPSIPRTLSDPIDIKNYLEELKQSEDFACDLETTGFDHRKDRITDISFCHQLGQGVHIKWENVLEFESLLKEVFLIDNIKVGQNIQFDILFLRQLGFKINNKIFDTMLAYHMLHMSSEGSVGNAIYSLDSLSWILTTEGGYKSILSKLGGIGKVQSDSENEQKTLFNVDEYESVDPDIRNDYDKYLFILKNSIITSKEAKLKELKLTPLQYYSAMDSDVTFRLYKNMKYKIDKDYAYPFYEIVMPLCLSLVQITLNGTKLDFRYMDKVLKENEQEIEKIKDKFFKKIGYTFNLNSAQEISNLLYNKLGILPDKKHITKKGNASGNVDAIEFYSKQKPVLKYILEYRGLQKQNSTYLIGMKKKADTSTHRLHSSYFQLTATGRGSSAFHTIPKDNRIRNMVIIEHGYKLLIADMSQIELRMLAFLSQDQNMIKAFESGHDFHTYTACEMFNIEHNKFDKENPEHKKSRDNAKIINFGIVYLMAAETLARDLGISLGQAQLFMNKFFNSYPKVRQFINETISFARQNGYVESLYGRRRYLPNIHSSSEYIRAEAERRAVNSKIQSSSADITNIAIIKIQNWLDKENKKSKIIATVHDSILVEVLEKEILEVSEKVVDSMTKNVPRINIMLRADLDILERWKK